MADTKITALAAITTVDPAADVLPIVDISDTSMAASGTTKKITSNQILGAGGTATLASATISGDLTVRTDKLAVRSTGVGIGTTTPNASYILDLTTAYDARARQWIADSSFIGSGNLANGFTIRTLSGTTDGIRFLNYAQTTEFMRIDATGLGVGGSPSYKLSSIGTTNNQVVLHVGNTAGTVDGDTTNVVRFAAGSGANALWANARYDGFSHAWRCNSTTTEAMTLDASGNLLLATTTNTPSARQYINQASGSNPALYIAGGASTTPLINFNGAGRMRSDGQYLVMETTNASGVIYITANTNGVYMAVGGTSWTANSDERLKDIIEPISNAVAKVGSLRSVIGKFKNDETNTRRSFLIAQDVQAVLPEAVDASNPDRLGVAYSEVIPLLVAAIKELAARVQTLETR